MKKGSLISLEALVKLIPHLILTIAIMVVIGMFVYYLLYPPLTDPQKDFKRLTQDLEAVMKAETGGKFTIKSPMQAKASYTMFVHPKPDDISEIPPRCKKQSCICIMEIKEGEPFETCKAYPDLKKCPGSEAPCGSQLCLANYDRIPVDEDKPISISINKNCNVIKISK